MNFGGRDLVGEGLTMLREIANTSASQNSSVCDLQCQSDVLRIEGLQQHLQQFVTHICAALSTTAERFAQMRGAP